MLVLQIALSYWSFWVVGNDYLRRITRNWGFRMHISCWCCSLSCSRAFNTLFRTRWRPFRSQTKKQWSLVSCKLVSSTWPCSVFNFSWSCPVKCGSTELLLMCGMLCGMLCAWGVSGGSPDSMWVGDGPQVYLLRPHQSSPRLLQWLQWWLGGGGGEQVTPD